MTPPTSTSTQPPAASAARRPGKRERLVAAAQEEIHARGFAATTLARIAEAADVPLGNVYYYFKTKDDIVRAVVDSHLEHVEGLLEEAEQAGSPIQRLERFLELMELNCDEVSVRGCPLGCLSQDLVKADGRFEGERDLLFARQLDWFEEQFRSAGAGAEARDLAVHLLACTQGASAICQALGQPDVLRSELGRARDWLAGVMS